MMYKLHEFVPSFTLYLNVEKAQNPAQKHLKTKKYQKLYLLVDNSYVVSA